MIPLIPTRSSSCLNTQNSSLDDELTMLSWQRRMRRSLVLLLAFDYANAFDLWPFKPKRFSGTALVGAGSLGLSDNERILAFGDFNGDQLYILQPHKP